jgi:hypothetical protein
MFQGLRSKESPVTFSPHLSSLPSVVYPCLTKREGWLLFGLIGPFPILLVIGVTVSNLFRHMDSLPWESPLLEGCLDAPS